MNPIGIMQGRLSAPSGGRIQSFPVDTWRKEFSLASEAGLDCIEWIYEAETETANPLQIDEGIANIQRLIEETGVAVWSICADYYMTKRLVTLGGAIQDSIVKHLMWLVSQAGMLEIRYIVLPFVDESSLKSPDEVKGLAAVMKSVIPMTEQTGVELHLETDLPPAELVSMLKKISHPLVRANYDIGNSAALGYNPVEELSLLGPWLGSVHIKDRVLGGGTVPLGTGAADLPTCFRLIAEADFQGPLILQVAREEGSSEVELALRNRHFVKKQLSAITVKA